MIKHNKQIALGKGVPATALVVSKEPETLEERLTKVEEKLHAMTVAFHTTKERLADKEGRDNIVDEVFGGQPKNKDNVPLNITLIGTTNGLPYILVVTELGEYMVGTTAYQSLSAAAEAVSGVRRSGWTFWKTADGRTAKEAYRS